jgi:hypothetical protein
VSCLEAAAKAAARSFYKYFIVLLLPDYFFKYSSLTAG